jgi:hypothetical protein
MNLSKHFLKEHHIRVDKELACMRYCALQVVRSTEEGNLGDAWKYQAEVNRSLKEVDRMAQYKKNVDEAIKLLNKIEAESLRRMLVHER